MVYIAIAFGIILIAIFLVWLLLHIFVSMIGVILPLAVATSLFYLLYRIIDSVDKKSSEKLFGGLLGVAIFILILWRVF